MTSTGQDSKCPSACSWPWPTAFLQPLLPAFSVTSSISIQVPILFKIPRDSSVFLPSEHVPCKCWSPEVNLVPSGNGTSVLPGTPLLRCVCTEPQGKLLSYVVSGDHMVDGSLPRGPCKRAEKGRPLSTAQVVNKCSWTTHTASGCHPREGPSSSGLGSSDWVVVTWTRSHLSSLPPTPSIFIASPRRIEIKQQQ